VDDARQRLSTARIGRLATVDGERRPAVVPCCFVLDGETVYSAVDDKPKTTRQLARFANVEANPTAALLVDHYDEDWSRLWWVRVRGRARTVEDEGERRRAVELLREKYPQYADHRLDGPVLALDVETWRGWSVRSDHG
jgi:PPOX class probable F420-dependent enzyme